jgi:hypothetical protein
VHEVANKVLACPQLNSSATDEEVEEALDFQLEELTVMAKKELELVDRMAEWRPWEAPEVGGGTFSIPINPASGGMVGAKDSWRRISLSTSTRRQVSDMISYCAGPPAGAHH